VRRTLALVLAAASLAAAAGGLRSTALMAPAVGLAIVAVAAWTSVTLAAWRLSISRHVLTQEAVEDGPVALRFEVGGLGRLPVRLEAQVDGATWVPLGPCGGELVLTIGCRGAYQLGPTPVRLRALGIVERRLHVGRRVPLLVLPRPDASALAAGAWAGGADDDADLDGLVPYTPGMPVGRIHWPTLARGAGLHARRIVTAAGGLPLVVVETSGNPEASAVDWAARVSAGHILGLARTGGCRVLLPGDRAPTTITESAGQWRTVHRRLALMQASDHGTLPAHVAGLLADALRIEAARAPAAPSRRTGAPLPPGVEPVRSPA
jgi:uncharacterized protein (DUF58 family)